MKAGNAPVHQQQRRQQEFGIGTHVGTAGMNHPEGVWQASMSVLSDATCRRATLLGQNGQQIAVTIVCRETRHRSSTPAASPGKSSTSSGRKDAASLQPAHGFRHQSAQK
jgi:hypothetical protein